MMRNSNRELVMRRVRVVWVYVDSLNFQPFYKKIKAVEGHVGRDAVDPKIVIALWMMATIEAIL